MKILKYLFFLILIFIIGTAIYFGTKDGTYDISDSMVIQAPPEVVFNKVNDYKNWESWGPWKKEDSTMTFNYAEKTVGEGGSYSWEGTVNGSMVTTKVIPNKEIEQDLKLETPAGERTSKVYWTFEETEEGTKVTWRMAGEHTLVDKAYFAITDYDFEEGIHKMNEAGLEGIAEEVAADMKRYSINVDGVTRYGGGYYMYTTTVAQQDEIAERMEPMLTQVMGFIEQNNLNMAGPPFTIYNQFDNTTGTVIFSAGIPVREQVITPEGSPVVCGFMDPVQTVKISLKGDYSHLTEAYKTGMEFIEKNNHQLHPTAKMFEVYVSDPGETPNPADWLTEIYIPITVQETETPISF
ncbi:SRPBCC family protein [Aequorivita echinoideorum]|uniref:SRPBCC family protein n=1 Tax=Aequorivita echinoideorum TaxID=1549647 RepID=A0ABS5S4W6_9FLAO|nr:SRPBCC family protein [Aequorivita echinoideorum]MBT0608258.1 SRPBCC family protein [Aequorivita echinoideorum]